MRAVYYIVLSGNEVGVSLTLSLSIGGIEEGNIYKESGVGEGVGVWVWVGVNHWEEGNLYK